MKDSDSPPLFDDLGGPPARSTEPELRPLEAPVWTAYKAQFIALYLRYFVFVTRHGTYLDAFAGPQDPENPDTSWAAKLVLESEPRWLREFLLCDSDPRKVRALEKLKRSQPQRKKGQPQRTVTVVQGDANDVIPGHLASHTPKGAAFCLLDQRTFECRWTTVEAVARAKPTPKVEIFYFLPEHWLDRAFAGVGPKGSREAELWWGSADWSQLIGMSREERARAFENRFRNLGYASVKAWPIYSQQGGGTTMFRMIHATDHPEAPKLMARAYRRATQRPEPLEQLTLEQLLASE